MEQLLIWGAGGHALVVADIVRRQGGYEVAGFLDDASPWRRGEPFADSVVLGGRDELPPLLARGVARVIIAVGDNASRLSLSEEARHAGLELVCAIHPSATIASWSTIAAGTVVCAGAVVAAAAAIGESVIVNSGATVDHECRIADGVHIGPGAHLGGGVIVERGAWVGIGAGVRDGVRIGSGAVVGAGAAVVRDVPPNVVVVGVPAEVLPPQGSSRRA